MERVIVVGPPGAGKSTLARALAAELASRHVELDALWWETGWTEVGPDEMRRRLREALGTGPWVVDGNYFSHGTRDTAWPAADTIVWLDLPRRVTFPRVVRRTAGRSVRRTELWNGNRESLRQMVGRDALIPFAWREHPNYRQRYAGLEHEPEFAHLTWIRLRSRREVRTWLASVASAPPTR